ncbi:MAG TPA: alpha/beta hydrolase, partial [Actinomycetota bacterium]|nr:alpha/beta hydrolase [Actinomycetota bacterium]
RLAGDHADVFSQLPEELHARLLRDYINSASFHDLPSDLLDALAAPWLGVAGQSAFYRQLEQRRADGAYIERMRSRYTTIQMPVLISAGIDDNWVPVRRSHEFTELVPDCELATFDNAGHLLQVDRPAQLTALLLDFLDRHAP